MFNRQPLDFVVIDQTLLVDAVLHGMKQLAGNVWLGAMGEMTAMRQRHAKNGVARLQQREIHRLIGLRAGVRLHICIRGAEQLLDAFDRQSLGNVDVVAAAVITMAGIALSVLVGELGALRLQHPWTGIVLRGDQLDVIFLALTLVGNRLGQFIVVTGDRAVLGKHSDLYGWHTGCNAEV